MAKYPQLGNNVESVIQFLGDEPIVDFARRFIFEKGVEVFNFGKHKGRPVADVLKAGTAVLRLDDEGRFSDAYQTETD